MGSCSNIWIQFVFPAYVWILLIHIIIETQLEIFSSIDIQPSRRFLNNDDIHKHLQIIA